MPLALKVDVAAISSLYQMPRATIPQRNARLDWAYGDVREVLAVSLQFTDSLQAYCQNRQGNLYEARISDMACSDSQWPYPQGFPNLFSPLDAGLQMLGMYGISGDITISAVNEYGADIQVCSAFFALRPP